MHHLPLFLLAVTHLTVYEVVRDAAVGCRTAVRMLARQLGALLLSDWRW